MDFDAVKRRAHKLLAEAQQAVEAAAETVAETVQTAAAAASEKVKPLAEAASTALADAANAVQHAASDVVESTTEVGDRLRRSAKAAKDAFDADTRPVTPAEAEDLPPEQARERLEAVRAAFRADPARKPDGTV